MNDYPAPDPERYTVVETPATELPHCVVLRLNGCPPPDSARCDRCPFLGMYGHYQARDLV